MPHALLSSMSFNHLGPVRVGAQTVAMNRMAPLSRRMSRLVWFEAVLCTVGLLLQLVFLATGDRVLPAVGLSLLVAGAVAAARTLSSDRGLRFL